MLFTIASTLASCVCNAAWPVWLTLVYLNNLTWVWSSIMALLWLHLTPLSKMTPLTYTSRFLSLCKLMCYIAPNSPPTCRLRQPVAGSNCTSHSKNWTSSNDATARNAQLNSTAASYSKNWSKVGEARIQNQLLQQQDQLHHQQDQLYQMTLQQANTQIEIHKEFAHLHNKQDQLANKQDILQSMLMKESSVFRTPLMMSPASSLSQTPSNTHPSMPWPGFSPPQFPTLQFLMPQFPTVSCY